MLHHRCDHVATGRRGDERFAMCSTFKYLLAAAILARVDKGEESLDRTLPVTASALKCFEQAEADGLADADATAVPVHWVKQQTGKGNA